MQFVLQCAALKYAVPSSWGL